MQDISVAVCVCVCVFYQAQDISDAASLPRRRLLGFQPCSDWLSSVTRVRLQWAELRTPCALALKLRGLAFICTNTAVFICRLSMRSDRCVSQTMCSDRHCCRSSVFPVSASRSWSADRCRCSSLSVCSFSRSSSSCIIIRPSSELSAALDDIMFKGIDSGLTSNLQQIRSSVSAQSPSHVTRPPHTHTHGEPHINSN